MIRRTVALLVLALVALALVQLDDPRAPQRPVASAVVGPSTSAANASTWFCPAAPADDATTHQVVVTALGRDVSARITGFSTAAEAPVSTVVEVPADSQFVQTVGDLGPALGGVTVEIDGGAAAVAHRLASPERSDQSDCVTEAGPSWYFAAAETELDRGRDMKATAHLWLLNPFPTDASVDIRISSDDGVRVPPALRGLIVPAGSSRLVDLGVSVERRAQFAVAVEARGGRIAAELAQTVPGQGLRLTPGVPEPADTWVMADSFGGENLVDRLVLFNPKAADTTVLVTVLPNDLDELSMPEPFEREIPGRQFTVIDLTAESRVPPEGLRWIRIDTLSGPGVVATQVVSLSGPGSEASAGTRPSIAGGLAATSGVSVQSTKWTLTSLDPSSDSQSAVVIANPSRTAISVVTLSSVRGGTVEVVAPRVEVPPLASLVIDVSAAATAGHIGLTVEATTPVVASGRTTSAARTELAMFAAVPAAGSASAVPSEG